MAIGPASAVGIRAGSFIGTRLARPVLGAVRSRWAAASRAALQGDIAAGRIIHEAEGQIADLARKGKQAAYDIVRANRGNLRTGRDLWRGANAAAESARSAYAGAIAEAQEAWDLAKASRAAYKRPILGAEAAAEKVAAAKRSFISFVNSGRRSAPALQKGASGVRTVAENVVSVGRKIRADAAADYQASRDMLAGSLRKMRSARDVYTVADKELKTASQLYESTREGVRSAAKKTISNSRVAMERVAANARKAAEAARGTAGQRFVAGVERVGSAIAKPFTAAGSYLSASVNGTGRGLGSAIANSRLVRWNPARLISAPVAGTFNKVENLGTRVFSTSTGLGKLGRALTSAKGNAAAFAIGSWVEAGINAYDFFKDKDNVDYLKQNGVLKSVGEAVTSKQYWAEVGKGLGRALTLGFWGGGDDTALDRWAGNTREGEDERNRQMNQLMAQGRNPVTGEVDQGALKREQAFVASQKMLAEDKALRAAGSAKFNEAGFRNYYAKLMAARDEAIGSAKYLADNWDNGGRQQARYHGTADKFLSGAIEGINKKYDAYFAAAMQNPEAKKVMEANRAAAYGMFFSGRDYAKDYELTGRDPNAVKGFAQFNERWGQLSDQQKVLWDTAAEKKVYEDARRAKVAEMKANAAKEAENGGAE